MRAHDILQAKTLAFLDANFEGHGFIEGVDGNGCDRTDLRLKYRVQHRLHNLQKLQASVPYATSKAARGARASPERRSQEMANQGGGEMASDYTFKKHQLTTTERLWLKEACTPGFSARAAKARLHGQLPMDFFPEKIDPRLYAFDRVTPIGLWHLDPQHPLLDAMDRTLRDIKTRILKDHALTTVTAAEVASTSGLTEQAVGQALRALGDNGHFYHTASSFPKGGGDGFERIELSDDSSFDNYLRYEGIEDLLERFYTRRGQALWGAVEYSEKLESRRTKTIAQASQADENKKVFIVHGRDDGTKEMVARFVEKLGFEAVILHERPNKGRTIITKFREESLSVGFAVVLMTPDDFGGEAGINETRKRARQNVVFELGFFIGTLKPERVAALVKGDIERPSDFDGVVYISLDRADWQTKLGTELRAAGYAFDWNKALL
jgi:predicted nucleotide-binding protein